MKPRSRSIEVAGFRFRQRPRRDGSEKFHGRPFDDAPALGGDLDGAPGVVAKVKINAAVGFAYPDERLVLDGRPHRP